MSKINFNNSIPSPVSVRYTATDGTQPLQNVGARSSIKSLKDLQPNTQVNVTLGEYSKQITYETGCRELDIARGIHDPLELNWQ
ncbi:hypothetical protein [Aquimarina longa]|uniref:hypothetical protein n=1 Tax=Aquimarina longa TaxID=1080221 RepID=UPI000781F478|nr:hypothetical protein [Aquimarina longa]